MKRLADFTNFLLRLGKRNIFWKKYVKLFPLALVAIFGAITLIIAVFSLGILSYSITKFYFIELLWLLLFVPVGVFFATWTSLFWQVYKVMEWELR